MAHDWVAPRINSGDSVIDATLGNGHDTVFLAQLVGEDGRVFAFDVQSEALESAKEKLDKAGLSSQCRLVLDGHENLAGHVGDAKVKAVMFNLGYLPGSDKSCITRAETTVAALQNALACLDTEGIITLVVYVGHPGGMEEAASVLKFCENLDSEKFRSVRYDPLNSRKAAPFFIGIESLTN
ncbi:MAG: class I SAM-dependent methyltransferase [Verrucomicrobiota bacterium]